MRGNGAGVQDGFDAESMKKNGDQSSSTETRRSSQPLFQVKGVLQVTDRSADRTCLETRTMRVE
jgi:hypothetical protein